LNGALTTSDVVKGGTGADTLRVAQSGTAASLTVTGVETLRMATGSVTGTLNFATAPSFTALRVDGDTAESGTNTLTGIGSTATTLAYRGDESTANAATAQQFNNLNIGPAGRIPQTYEMDKLTQQFKHLNIGHAGRIPQMHPSSRVYESAAAQFAYPQVPKKWEDLKPHARMPRRKPKQEPRRRSRSPSNLRERLNN
jgi:hypothetical protein